ncbi:phosphoribosyltransferase family protein [Planctomycetota bacterium]|nr:phosphoribosyltransferase family protein [Planctomycetota bacterium]
MPNGYKTVYTEEQIQERVDALAAQISERFNGKPLLCLVVLRGGFFFGSDLIKAMDGVKVELDFVKLESYAGNQQGSLTIRGQVPAVSGYDVLVIEDLVDTGLTLAELHEALKAQGPRSLQYAVVVDKKAHRKVPFDCEYICFDLAEDQYLVGYGMDDNGKGRNLPYIGVIG